MNMFFTKCDTGGGCTALVNIKEAVEYIITDGDACAPSVESKHVELFITEFITGKELFPSMKFKTLLEASRAAFVLSQIHKLQKIQKMNRPDSSAWLQASELLAPLFEEMKTITA